MHPIMSISVDYWKHHLASKGPVEYFYAVVLKRCDPFHMSSIMTSKLMYCFKLLLRLVVEGQVPGPNLECTIGPSEKWACSVRERRSSCSGGIPSAHNEVDVRERSYKEVHLTHSPTG